MRIGGYLSAKTSTRRGVPQGAVLSPQLFNILMSTFPEPPPGVSLITYADDVTVLVAADEFKKAEQLIQPYLDDIYNWGVDNGLCFSADKSAAMCIAKSIPANDDPVFLLRERRVPMKHNV